MHRNKTVSILASLLLAASSSSRALAGGFLETPNITANAPSPRPGEIAAPLVPIRWDSRCLPVRYAVNNTQDPIPVPPSLGARVLSVAQATAAFERALASWTQIPTSYIDMRVDGTTGNPGLVRFDMTNELSFRTASNFTAIASSPSFSLIRDEVFADGDDIDGDGDSDVSAAIATCQDADGDGDFEFPPGAYKAGTIIDNDVQFNTKASGLRFTVNDADIDTVTNSVDLEGVAVHEFGHSLGLSHVLNNQKSRGDGNGATMFPFIDTGDPAAELSIRSLDSDDIAFASLHYPEGSASSGPAALQPGDVAFKKRYGLVTGTLHHGVLNLPTTGGNQPIAAGGLFAVDLLGRSVTASAYSGTTQVSFNPANGGLFLVPGSPEFHILDGKFTLPLPLGLYSIGIQALDGNPAAAGNISLSAQIGAFFGQHNFNDEFYGFLEADLERFPGFGKPLLVLPGVTRSGVNVVTNRTININKFGNRNFIGFTSQAPPALPVPPGRYYAVRIPAAEIVTANPDPNLLVHGALFDTALSDASTVARFSEAQLTTGVVNADGSVSVDLVNPLARDQDFLARDNDFAPFFVRNPISLGKKLRKGIDDGTISNVFVVLRLPTETPFPGVSAQPPLIGLDGGVPVNDVPIHGLSYQSNDGTTWTQSTTFNFRFSLVLSEPPPPFQP